MRHISNTLITTEQDLWEQIKKGTGRLVDIFKRTVPVMHGSMFQSYATDSDTYGT